MARENNSTLLAVSLRILWRSAVQFPEFLRRRSLTDNADVNAKHCACNEPGIVDGAGDGDGVVDVDDASPGASVLGERVDGVDDEVGAVDDAEPHPMRVTATSIASAKPSNRSEPVFR